MTIASVNVPLMSIKDNEGKSKLYVTSYLGKSTAIQLVTFNTNLTAPLYLVDWVIARLHRCVCEVLGSPRQCIVMGNRNV